MATNARIERLTREALGASPQPMHYPPGFAKTLARIALALFALGAVAGTLAPDAPAPSSARSFVGTPPDVSAGDSGNARDLTY